MNVSDPREALRGLEWLHVDVFADGPLQGNGLSVFFDADRLDGPTMQALTAEMRQFESIFLLSDAAADAAARIFTMQEELAFAGHPLLGAAAALARRKGRRDPHACIFALQGRYVTVRVGHEDDRAWAEMDQGPAQIVAEPSGDLAEALWTGHGLTDAARRAGPIEVISTGLPYAILPVTPQGLENARIDCDDFGVRLAAVGAAFAYVFCPDLKEGRSWDNAGLVEDVATGSAAGPAAAYLWRRGFDEDLFTMNQGRFVGRPSRMFVRRDSDGRIHVGGGVIVLGEGRLV